MSSKTKILIIENLFPEYRVFLFERLAEYYEITIAHLGKKKNSPKLEEIILTKNQIGPFYYTKGEPDFNRFEVVIHNYNIRYLNLFRFSTNHLITVKNYCSESEFRLHIQIDMIKRKK